jgi:hypothetical protein
MAWQRTFMALAACLLATPGWAADDDEAYKKLAPLTSAERVFIGKLTKATPGPVANSFPPIYTFTFQFEPGDALRGTKPAASEAYSYQIRTMNQPVFNSDATYLVGVNGKQVVALMIAEKEDLARAKKLMALPGGWSIEGGKPISPWALLGEKAWPKDGPKLSETLCSKTGRPALLCGETISWKVEQVPAKNPMKFRNDMYGDGTFKVSVTNTGKAEAAVPALLTDGKGTILWADSVLLSYKGKAIPFAGAGKVTKDSKPLTLKSGETVSGELDTLPVEGIEWPRGGMRVYFDFQLGEKSANNFFYYFSATHDPMRDAAIKKAKGG